MEADNEPTGHFFERVRITPGGRSLFAWVFVLGFSTLLLEILLVRIFDCIVGANAAYSIVTLAVFGSGIAGTVVALRPNWLRFFDRASNFGRLGLLFAVSVGVLYPILEWLPFQIDRIAAEPWIQFPAFLVLYLALTLPFAIFGFGMTAAFSVWPSRTRVLYACDLVGAGLGAIVLAPLLPHLGPVGTLALIVGGSALISLWHLIGSVPAIGIVINGLGAILVSIVALAGGLERTDIRSHADKRSAEETSKRSEAEFRKWDPISKIEVVDLLEIDESTGHAAPGTDRKLISYDGGSQSSHIYRFDGDYETLRRELPDRVLEHFWQRGVLASHFLLRDRGSRVLAIGCSGGQEVTAALMFGARKVDAIDLVGTVIDLGHDEYARFNGGIFHDPRVRFYQAEARSLLRSHPEPFDIIQIFSYHNSSRIASGAGAVKAYYLQTAETYALCLDNLSPDGILQINQAFYPRVITTLARAWDAFGLQDLRAHVVVYARDGLEDHATILVKQSPWTAAELADLDSLLLAEYPSEGRSYRRVEDPLSGGSSFLPESFYEASAADSLSRISGYRIDPVTDDRPFAFHLRKNLRRIDPDPRRFVDESAATLLNQVFYRGISLPRDVLHLILVGIASLVLASATILIPLFRSAAGREPWPRRGRWLLYFGGLGIGFLLLELVWIQRAMQVIGYPLHAYATVLATLLASAGLGSALSGWIERRVGGGHRVLVMLVTVGFLTLLVSPSIFSTLEELSLPAQILGVGATLAPWGFFMGMPFPIGLTALADAPPGAVGWAWGINAVFSVAGGLLSVLLSIEFGFQWTLWIGLGVYGIVTIVGWSLFRWSEVRSQLGLVR